MASARMCGIPHSSRWMTTSPRKPSTRSSSRSVTPATLRAHVRATIVCMHEDLIRSGRRRCRVAAGIGVMVLTFTIASVVFPIAWVLGAMSSPFGTGLGVGRELLLWSLEVSVRGRAGHGRVRVRVVVAPRRAGGAATSSARGRALRRAPSRLPRCPTDTIPRVERLLAPLALAAGVTPPASPRSSTRHRAASRSGGRHAPPGSW